MSSANNTLGGEEGAGEQEGVPSTISVLDKSKSLFGNPSATIPEAVRDPTPDAEVGEAVDSSVAMETDESPITEEEKQDEPMETNGEEEDLPEAPKEIPAAEEEVFEKKIVSMDTEKDEEQEEATEGDTEHNEEVAEEVEDEEEEAPKKKSKRAATLTDDDMDETQEDEEHPEASEQTKEQSEVIEQQNGAPDSAESVESADSASLHIDESEETEEIPESAPRSSRARRSTGGAPKVAEKATPRRGRSSRAEKKEEVEEPEENEEEEVVPTPKRSGRGRRSAPAVEEKAPEEEEPEEEAEQEEHDQEEQEEAEEPTPRRGRGAAKKVETPKSTGRARRSAPATPKSPKATRKSARNAEPEEPEGDEQEKEPEPETRKSTRSRKSTAKVQEPELEDTEEPEPAEEKDEEPTTSSRRSTRAKAPAATTPAKRTPARGRKAAEPKATPSKKKEEEFDPYDMDTEMEHHPVPLKNIQMEVQNFGAVKYAKAGTSEAKYSMTERTAESRISELQSSSGSKNKKSLADMTPAKEKVKHRMSLGTPGGRKKATAKKEQEEDHEEDQEMEVEVEVKTPTARGKKRKSEAATPSAKKVAQDLIPELDHEQQLVVDHPSDDNEPYAPGARVYAIFQKEFYPAVILGERDGLGRYKLQFVADKVVKDVPNAGIIPLRDVVQGKRTFSGDDEYFVDNGPSDFSAQDWAQGRVVLRILDDDGEATNETKTVGWTEISFDAAEWKDYVKEKEQAATAVVASNITTISEATRARKTAVAATTKPSNSSSSKNKKRENTSTEEDENELLPLNEKAVGKNIFAGKVFILTSANRHSSAMLPPPLRKKNLMEFIVQNGGVVTEQLTERYAGQNMLLISDTYYRTHKYLAALANGIPCVRNEWLQQCALAGELVDYTDFILPAGSSLFDESDQPAPENPSKLLDGKVLYVHSTHMVREKTQTGPGGTFVEIWSPMLKLLGATIIDEDWEKVLAEEQKYDVVLVDGTFRDEVLDYTKKIGAKAVTSEWVIQTIILGEAPEPDSHPKFDPYRLHHRPRHSP